MTLEELKNVNSLVENYKKRIEDMKNLRNCFEKGSNNFRLDPYWGNYNYLYYLTDEEVQLVLTRIVKDTERIKETLIAAGIDVRKI